jgi:hypothetical protein
MPEIRITIYKKRGKYYSTLGFVCQPLKGKDIIFFKETFPDSGQDLEDLKEAAKKEARKRGIAHVINLD